MNNAEKDFWKFDPTNNSWTQISDIPMARVGSFSFSIGNKGYTGAGDKIYGFLKDFYEYSPNYNLNIDNKNLLKSDFKFSPNPFSENTNLVNNSPNTTAQLFIYNISGTLVKRQNLTEMSTIINREGIPVGMYLYKIITDKGNRINGKILIE